MSVAEVQYAAEVDSKICDLLGIRLGPVDSESSWDGLPSPTITSSYPAGSCLILTHCSGSESQRVRIAYANITLAVLPISKAVRTSFGTSLPLLDRSDNAGSKASHRLTLFVLIRTGSSSADKDWTEAIYSYSRADCTRWSRVNSGSILNPLRCWLYSPEMSEGILNSIGMMYGVIGV
jgi:hypothetical protein